jgi:amino acid adenylation domain-containing protein
VQPFDLSALPLIRVTLFRLRDAEHVLLLNMHHIIGDGLSVTVMMQELDECYRAFTASREPVLRPLPMQYGDFAAWERGRDDPGAGQAAFWRERLSAPLPALEIPGDSRRPPMQSFAGSNVFFTIPRPLAETLAELGAREGCTFFMTQLAAFQTLLHRYAGADDLIVGTPVSMRAHPGTEHLIGNFLNMVALRCDLSGDPSFADVLRRSRAVTLDAFSHCDLPYESMLKHLRVARDPGRNAVFQVMLQVLSAAPPRLGDLDVEGFHFDLGIAQFDLALHLYEEPHGYTGRFEYCTDLFERATIERMAANYQCLLRSVAADPAQPVGRVSMLAPAERERVLHGWNGTTAPVPEVRVHELFEAQCARAPARVAIRAGAAVLSYAELEARANRIARLLHANGLRRGDRVGLCLDRGADLVAAVLGVFKAGAAYVPLDPVFPEERLRFMADDARVAMVVCGAGPSPAAFASHERLTLDERAIASMDASPPEATAAPGDPAYIIYTSGSTGTPKGVVVPHRAVVNFLVSMSRAPGMTADDVLVAVTTLSFDIAVLELHLPLIVGGTVVIADRDETTDGAALGALIDRHSATAMQATPATWQMLLDAGWRGRDGFKALVGGEALTPALANRLLAHGVELWNLYGPTETTVWSTCGRVSANDTSITIGAPIANTSVLVLDRHGGLAPVGVPGEACIGGAGVSLGYFNRPDLTAARFVRTPVADARDELVYRTGDLVRWRADGRLEHLGRLDRQLKINGFRVEPAEIESVLERHPSVARAVVDARSSGGGEQRLVAYVVLERGADLTPAEARRYLRAWLPGYMVPGIVAPIATVPMSPNGKVDRTALPDPYDSARAAVSFEAPRGPAEELLATIWCELLQVNRVGRHDNFFELGGHSLLALRAVHAVHARTGRRIDTRRFFFQTLAQIAGSLADASAAAG